MSAPEFTTKEMVAELERIATQAERMAEIRALYGLDPSIDTTRQAALYRAIAARLSDPWSAFAGWQPPPEPERADGFRCLGWSLGGGLWEEIVWWSDRGGRWSDATGNTLRGTHAPTAFAPLPPPPKETTDVER